MGFFFRHRVEREEYENYIVDLEIKTAQNTQKITDLHEELRFYLGILQINDIFFICNNNTVTLYKEKKTGNCLHFLKREKIQNNWRRNLQI